MSVKPEHVRFITTGTFVMACMSATVGFIFTTVYLTFNLYHRNKRFMKMSSPRLNILISSGGLTLNSACMLYGIEYFFRHLYSHATVICQMRTWLVSLGVTLLFGPLLVKSWRVYQIFKNAGIKRVVITDRRLILVIVGFLSVDILILSLWQGLDPPKSRPTQVSIQTETASGEINNTYVYIQECVSRRTDIWLSIILFWKAALLAASLFMAWKTKHVLLPAMRDSSCMIISVVSTMFLTSQAMMIAHSLRHIPDAVYTTYIVLIAVCSSIVQCAIFYPKVQFYWKTSLEQQMRMSVSTHEAHHHLPAADYFGDEVIQLVAENDTLKKSLTQKNSVIQILEGHLTNAKQKLNRLKSDRDLLNPRRRADSGLDTSSSSYHELESNSATPLHHSETPRNLSDYQIEADKTDHQETKTITPVTVQKGMRRTNSDRVSSRGVHKNRLTVSASGSTNCFPSQDINYLSAEIDADITHAHMLSTSLRNSIETDLQRSITESTCNWVFDSIKSRQDVAGSVARCYDIEDNSDTLSYISSYLPCKLARKRLDYNIKPSSGSQSCESVSSNLANDQYYPMNKSSESHSCQSYTDSRNCESSTKGSNSSRSPKRNLFTKYLVSESTGVKGYYL